MPSQADEEAVFGSARLIDTGPCPYLPDRNFRALVLPEPVDGRPGADRRYRQLMDHNFRRLASLIYRPHCPGCTACQVIRVPVACFRPRRDQRRCAMRNRDLRIDWRPGLCLDAEHRALFRRYQGQVHDDHLSELDQQAEFGGQTCWQCSARSADGRLLAVSQIDRFDDALSSVYCFYDPDAERRSLGTFMALQEIAWAREQDLDWWYVGYWVAGCAALDYKRRFLPHERLVDGIWRASEA